MDEDIKDRFAAVEKLIEHTEKRFDDVKWYFGGAATLFTVGFSVLTVLLSWNYNSEKQGLRDFQKDLKIELGKVDIPPDLEILGINRSPLQGQEIVATVDKDEQGWVTLHVNHFLRNKGGAPTGPVFLKFYTNDPLQVDNRSTDEPNYKYETYLYNKLEPNDLPGGVSFEYYHNFVLQKEMPRAGKYECLIKFYYGKGKVAQAHFTLVIR